VGARLKESKISISAARERSRRQAAVARRPSLAELRECLRAFREERCLPSGAMGPEDLAPLRREASICLSVRMAASGRESSRRFGSQTGKLLIVLVKLVELTWAGQWDLVVEVDGEGGERQLPKRTLATAT
jgi:hypothetical protein